MLRFRICSRNSHQRSENLLGKTHCDRKTEEHPKKEADSCTFDYSVRVINNHAGLTLTLPTGTTFLHLNAR